MEERRKAAETFIAINLFFSSLLVFVKFVFLYLYFVL